MAGCGGVGGGMVTCGANMLRNRATAQHAMHFALFCDKGLRFVSVYTNKYIYIYIIRGPQEWFLSCISFHLFMFDHHPQGFRYMATGKEPQANLGESTTLQDINFKGGCHRNLRSQAAECHQDSQAVLSNSILTVLLQIYAVHRYQLSRCSTCWASCVCPCCGLPH